MDFDFGAFLIVALVVVFIVSGAGIVASLPRATYDGPDLKGDSGMVVAGSGEELAVATGPEADPTSADQWLPTSGTPGATEEPTAAVSGQDGLIIKITLEDSDSTLAWVSEILCLVGTLIMLAVVSILWKVVKKEFGNGA